MSNEIASRVNSFFDVFVGLFLYFYRHSQISLLRERHVHCCSWIPYSPSFTAKNGHFVSYDVFSIARRMPPPISYCASDSKKGLDVRSEKKGTPRRLHQNTSWLVPSNFRQACLSTVLRATRKRGSPNFAREVSDILILQNMHTCSFRIYCDRRAIGKRL